MTSGRIVRFLGKTTTSTRSGSQGEMAGLKLTAKERCCDGKRGTGSEVENPC